MEEGGAEKLRENDKNKLIIDAAKCAKLTDMLAVGAAGLTVVPATRGDSCLYFPGVFIFQTFYYYFLVLLTTF